MFPSQQISNLDLLDKHSDASKGAEDGGAKASDRTPTKASRKTKVKKGKTKNNGAPTRPLSAYNIFFKENREKILFEKDQGIIADDVRMAMAESEKEYEAKVAKGIYIKRRPGLFESMAKTIAARWKNLSTTEMKKYTDLAVIATEQYRVDMEAYHQKLMAKSIQRASIDVQMQLAEQRQAVSADELFGASPAPVPVAHPEFDFTPLNIDAKTPQEPYSLTHAAMDQGGLPSMSLPATMATKPTISNDRSWSVPTLQSQSLLNLQPMARSVSLGSNWVYGSAMGTPAVASQAFLGFDVEPRPFRVEQPFATEDLRRNQMQYESVFYRSPDGSPYGPQ